MEIENISNLSPCILKLSELKQKRLPYFYFLRLSFLKVYYNDCHNYALTFKVILLTKKYLGNKLLYSSQFSRESISFDVSDTVSH